MKEKVPARLEPPDTSGLMVESLDPTTVQRLPRHRAQQITGRKNINPLDGRSAGKRVFAYVVSSATNARFAIDSSQIQP